MSTYRKYFGNRKVILGTGLSSLVAGFVVYHTFLINKYLSSVVNTKVLDNDQKRRPDYVYINYSIYKESIRKIQQKQEVDRNFVNIIINPAAKWWKSFKHSLAWRLLKMAQTGDKLERIKAVHQLSLLSHLKSWDYQHLAQICDARTAIALARSETDLRFFLPPRKLGIVTDARELVQQIHTLLEKVKFNECAQKLIKLTFSKYKLKTVDDDEKLVKFGSAMPKEETMLLKQCVEILCHLTEDRKVAEKIIEEGGLVQLMELYKVFRNSMEMKLKLCNIIANLSCCADRAHDFFVTGWISVLAMWSRDIDIRINVTANKALTNLDEDDHDNCIYKPKIYPLYPRNRRQACPKLDVVFVHGILGGVFYTWRQKESKFQAKKRAAQKNGNNESSWRDGTSSPDAIIPMMRRNSEKRSIIFDNPVAQDIMETINQARSGLNSDWEVVYADCPEEASLDAKGQFSVSGEDWVPSDEEVNEEEYTNCWAMDWLQDEFPQIRVIGLNYTSTLSEWFSKVHGCGCQVTQGTIESRAKEFLDHLAEAGVGTNRPVIWVGHSMGGLIVKSIITQALENEEKRAKDIGFKTKGIMFLAVPHRGTSVAKLKQHLQVILNPTMEVKQMQENASSLLKLHDNFMKHLKNNIQKPVEVVSIVEGKPTVLTPFKLSYDVVTEESAKLDVGDFFRLTDDHLGISKPDSKQSFLYQKLIQVIQTSLNDDLKEQREPTKDLWQLFQSLIRFW